MMPGPGPRGFHPGGVTPGKRHVVVGDGAAGMTAARTLRELDSSASITVLSDDPHPAYFRAALTNYLLGELREEHIWAVPPNFYRQFRIERFLTRVARVDAPASRLFLTSSAEPIPFDRLLIATGSRARHPVFEGAELPGVMTLRTLQDVRWVMDLVKLHGLKRAVVVGGGPLALEWAFAMRERGVHVTVLVRDTRFMLGALDPIGSDLVLARMRRFGVDVRMSDEVRAAIPDRNGRLAAVALKSGGTIACELLAAAIGVVCNTDFLADSGVATGKSGGIVVDERMQTSVASIYAAGDVVEIQGKLDQKWEPARLQGRVAAQNMAGGQATYRPGVPYFATRLYDLDFASIGDVSPSTQCEELRDQPKQTGFIAYRKLVLREGRLVGALMLGQREERVRQRGKLYKQLVDSGADVSSIKNDLLDPAFDLGGWLKTRELACKPKPSKTMAGAAPARLKGTQALNLADLVPPRADDAAAKPKRGGTQVVESRPSPAAPAPGAPPLAAPPIVEHPQALLSIGLPAPLRAIAPGAAPAVAFLEGMGRRWPLDAAVINIGSDPQGAIVVAQPGVSHVHAQITRYDQDQYVRDLGSNSGTWVNGAAVTVPHLLRHGDRIRIGPIELVVAMPTARQSQLPAQSSHAPAAAASQPRLEVQSGHGLGMSFVLAASPVGIGRDPASSIRLDDLSVSRRHALLTNHGGIWFVCDLHSSRGTYRNGARIAPGDDVALAEGDRIQIGDSSLLFTARAKG